MASTSGIQLPTYQPPVFNEASSVISRIEAQTGVITDLFGEVAQILKDIASLQSQLAALQPPSRPSGDDDDAMAAFHLAMQRYLDEVAKLKDQIATLNSKLVSVQMKLSQAQVLLQRLQGIELPAAQRRDADRLRQEVNRAQQAIDDTRKAVDSGSGDGSDKLERAQENRIVLRTQQLKQEIRLQEDPSFKQLINCFVLVPDLMYQLQASSKATGMQSTPGAGLPDPRIP